jgi:hypothetical protein
MWSKQLGSDLLGLALLLAPIVDRDVKAFVNTVLNYTGTFPSVRSVEDSCRSR